MGLTPGSQLGSCEVLGPLGAGGMGEVWRARDTKLGRDVAIKALPDAFARDASRLVRIEREAQVLAALNHPNLAIIHELRDVGGEKYLIMELVEGDTLAERIDRGALALNEALDVALQVAGALSAAHDRGIVHRDLKPANIKVTPEGRVKVLDFGLAKVNESSSDVLQDLSHSPTLGGLETGAGLVLGTAAYMSPEQARGKDVDRRTDVWAFGCVLYEMLTGRQTFPTGETLSDTLAGILVREPEWSALPPATPPRIRTLLERCLRKDDRKRLRDMGDARVAIEEAKSESDAIALAALVPADSRRREMVFAGVAIAGLLTASGLAVPLFLQRPPASGPVRFDLAVPVGVPNSFYLSPDGRKVAFVTVPQAGARIWVRPIEALAAEPIPSTEGISPAPTFGNNANVGQNNLLFWSADSQNIAFVAEGRLKKVAAAGGPAQVLATLPAGGNYFGTWNGTGVILIASDAAAGGPLLRVPAGGGQPPMPATELDKSRKETSHRFPHFLPDGRHFLYVGTGSDAKDRITYVGTLDSNERRPLPGIAAEVKYSMGHLVFVRDGALMAQPFDVDRLELTGEAFTVADRFAPPTALTWTFSASESALAYRTSGENTPASANLELVWYDAAGSRQMVAGAEGEYLAPELSPDGKLVAFARGTPADIWTLDIEKNVTSKWTTDAAHDFNPRWSPDGKVLAFDSARDGVANLYQRAVGVTGADTLVFKSDAAKTLSDWSRDGKYLAYIQDNDVWALALSSDTKGEHKPIQVTKTSFTESHARISPDSKWIAYVSNKSGQREVYIQSFPEPGVEQQVSRGAGGPFPGAEPWPRWRRDGTQLFYFTATNNAPQYMSVTVKPSGTALNAAAPALVFPHPVRRAPFSSVFGVTADGRFLMHVAPSAAAAPTQSTGGAAATPGAAPGSSPSNGITLILNWAAGRGSS
jgi:serine/threonine protein kinase